MVQEIGDYKAHPRLQILPIQMNSNPISTYITPLSMKTTRSKARRRSHRSRVYKALLPLNVILGWKNPKRTYAWRLLP